MLDGVRSGFQKFGYELHIQADAGSGPAEEYASSGSLQTYYTPDYLTVSGGISLDCSRQGDGGGGSKGRTANLNIPALGISQSWTDANDGSVLSTLTLDGLRLITMPSGVWKLTGDSITWVVNGSTVYTGGAFSLTSGMAPTESAIPLIGIGPRFIWSASYGTVHAIPSAGTGSATFTPGSKASDGNGHAGYRVKLNGTWYTDPISLMPTTVGGVVSATDCNNVTIVGHADETLTAHTITQNFQIADVWITPDNPAGLVRLASGYEALIGRYGFPRVQRNDATVVDTHYSDDTDNSVVSNSLTEIYPLDTIMLAGVTDSPHVIETPITRTKYSLSTVKKTQNYAEPTFTRITTQSSSVSQGTVDTSTMSAALKNSDATLGWIACVHNSTFAPFACYFEQFLAWNAFGGSIDANYWIGKTCQQWMYNVSLPVGENTKHRTSHISDALSQNGITGVASNFTGYPTFWGMNDLLVEEPENPASIATDSTSSSRFTFYNSYPTLGSGSVGSDIVLTTGDMVRFQWVDFTAKPYAYPAICTSVNVTWSTTNVSNLKVYLVGYDGTKVLLTDNVQGTFALPGGTSTKWATTQGVEFADPYGSDTYNTPRAGDDTATALSDQKKEPTFSLMPGHSPYWLEFDVTKTNPANPVTIHHPVFYAGDFSKAKVFYPTARENRLLFENGPGVGFGLVEFFDYLADTIKTDPLPLSDPELRYTLGDGYCFKQSFFKGVQADTNLTTWAAANYVYNEEYTVNKELWGNPYTYPPRSPDTGSFLLNSSTGVKIAFWSSWRQMPSPRFFTSLKKETTSGWQETGTRGNWRYSLTCSKHPVIHPGSTMPQLIKSGTNYLTTATSPSGWSVGTHSISTNNDEGYDYELWWDSKKWFQMRPWRGNFNVFGIPSHTALGGWIVEDDTGRLHVAYILDGNVWFKRSNNSHASSGWVLDNQVSSSSDAVRVRFDYDTVYKRCELYYETSAHSIYYTYSNDEGGTWHTPVLVGTNMLIFSTATNHHNGDKIRVWAEYVSGSSGPMYAKGQYRRYGDTAWSGTFTFQNGGANIQIADGGMCNVDFAWSGQNEIVWCPVINGDSAVTTWFSNDFGRNWKKQT